MKQNPFDNAPQMEKSDASHIHTVPGRKKPRQFKLEQPLKLAAIILIIAVAIFAINKMIKKDAAFEDKLASQIAQEVDGSTIVLSQNGSRRTVADFKDPIIVSHGKETRLIVHTAVISETVTISDVGLGGWSWTSAYKEICYEGNAQYTVDLSELSDEDFAVNNENKTITVRIPYAILDPINIPADKIKCGDVKRGWLAPKDIKLTVEENAQLMTNVNNKMKAKLIDDNIIDVANESAKSVVEKLFSTTVRSVDPEFKVIVVQ